MNQCNPRELSPMDNNLIRLNISITSLIYPHSKAKPCNARTPSSALC